MGQQQPNKPRGHGAQSFYEDVRLMDPATKLSVMAAGGPVWVVASSRAASQSLHLAPGEARDLAALLGEAADVCDRERARDELEEER